MRALVATLRLRVHTEHAKPDQSPTAPRTPVSQEQGRDSRDRLYPLLVQSQSQAHLRGSRPSNPRRDRPTVPLCRGSGVAKVLARGPIQGACNHIWLSLAWRSTHRPRRLRRYRDGRKGAGLAPARRARPETAPFRPFHKPGAGWVAYPRCWRSTRTAISSSYLIEQTPTSGWICSSTPTTDARAIPAGSPWGEPETR